MVERRFDRWIDWKLGKKIPEIAKWLKSHESKPKCIDNLCEQVQTLENRTPMNRSYDAAVNVTKLIDGAAKMFAYAAVCEREKSTRSPLENARLRKSADETAAAKALAEENFLDVTELPPERKKELDRMLKHKELDIPALKKK